jgi:hypothetical protein
VSEDRLFARGARGEALKDALAVEYSIINAVIAHICSAENRSKIVFPQPARDKKPRLLNQFPELLRFA